MVGLLTVAAMFTSGVVLLWIGLHRRAERLPKGAEAVLAAVAEGRLEPRPRPAELPAWPETEVPSPTKAVPAPVASTLAADEDAGPAVRLVPRGPEPTPTTRPATAAQLVAAARSGTTNEAPGARPPEPLPARPAARPPASGPRAEPEKVAVGVAALEEFFAKEPQLHRF